MKRSHVLTVISGAVVLAAILAYRINRKPISAEILHMTESEAAMPVQSPKQIAMMWAVAYNRHDPDAAADLYDVNATNEQMPYGKPVHGREAMRATYLKVFQAFPDIHVEVERIMEDGHWVAVEWLFSGTMRGEFAGHPPNNSHFSMRGCELFQVVDGKIRVQRGYWDRATMFSQLKITLKM